RSDGRRPLGGLHAVDVPARHLRPGDPPRERDAQGPLAARAPGVRAPARARLLAGGLPAAVHRPHDALARPDRGADRAPARTDRRAHRPRPGRHPGGTGLLRRPAMTLMPQTFQDAGIWSLLPLCVLSGGAMLLLLLELWPASLRSSRAPAITLLVLLLT